MAARGPFRHWSRAQAASRSARPHSRSAGAHPRRSQPQPRPARCQFPLIRRDANGKRSFIAHLQAARSLRRRGGHREWRILATGSSRPSSKVRRRRICRSVCHWRQAFPGQQPGVSRHGQAGGPVRVCGGGRSLVSGARRRHRFSGAHSAGLEDLFIGSARTRADAISSAVRPRAIGLVDRRQEVRRVVRGQKFVFLQLACWPGWPSRAQRHGRARAAGHQQQDLLAMIA
jgi:hypothetical protein